MARPKTQEPAPPAPTKVRIRLLDTTSGPQVDLRVHIDGQPTLAGFRLPVHQLPALERCVSHACDVARAKGLITEVEPEPLEAA